MSQEDDIEEPVEPQEPAETGEEPVEPQEPAETGEEPVEPQSRLAGESRSSFQDRVRGEIERRKKAENEAAEYRRLLMDIQREQLQRQQPRIDPEEEARQVAMMEVPDQVRYYTQKSLQAHGEELRKVRAELQWSQDRSKFESRISAIPEYKKHEEQVEQMYQDYFNRGIPVERNMILSYLVGEEDRKVREKSSSVVARARKTGEENIRRQQTKPFSARGDISGVHESGKKSASDILKERLETRAYTR